MQQITQNIRNGAIIVRELPDPIERAGQVLIANAASLISAGTEKSVMELASKSLVGKAMERPDQLRRVMQKIKTDGLWTTIRQVREKLNEPMQMGYSSAGVVVGCGAGVDAYKVGDRVVSNGPHAGVVSVPRNLVANLPDSVSFEHGAFAVVGSIALQGFRLAKTTLGETVFVVGLGLVGQMAAAMARAAGCRVIGTDPDAGKCELALKMGCDVARPNIRASEVAELTGGMGADAILITASTKSNGPIELAADAVRPKGRIVLVGVIGLEMPRRPMYFKEAEFVVSCSYGPGRYDALYEERGVDYPAPHVRWTEQRNIAGVVDMMASGMLDVAPLISHQFDISEGEKAYQLIAEGSEPYLGVILKYPQGESFTPRRVIERSSASPAANGEVAVGCLGAGNFARMTLFPAMQKLAGVKPVMLCSAGGLSASHAGEKMDFSLITTNEDEVFNSNAVNTVVALTRHNQHAGQVLKAIKAGKHVFVEKPLALTLEEVQQIDAALAEAGDSAPLVMVGFNRRFSPATVAVKKHFAKVNAPLTMMYRFNAGEIPGDSWVQDDEVGGGRIIGEACHAIDLCAYLCGSVPVRVYAESIGGETAPEITDDQAFITVRFANGAVASIGYLAGGEKAMPKERIEVLGGGRMAVIDDFRLVELAASGRIEKAKSNSKGHAEEVKAFFDAVREGKPSPISWNELRTVARATILAVHSLREGAPFFIETEPADAGEPSTRV